jgi:hypothetical protein
VTVPRVLGIDDFALRRGLVYATVLIDAETGRRVDVVPGRTAGVAEKWLKDHPGVEIVCRPAPVASAPAMLSEGCRTSMGCRDHRSFATVGGSFARCPERRERAPT